MKKLLFSASLILSSALAFQASAQYVQGWGNNGTAAPTSGTWDTTTANWAPSNTLSASMVTFTNGNFALFTASNTAVTTVSALTITVPGTVTCEGIGDGVSYNSGGLTAGAAVASLNFVGAGSINLPAGSWSFTCGASANNMTFNVPITGAGQIVQHNSGQLSLYGNNTYTGGTAETGGQIINYNNNNSFGTGTITNTGGNAIYICTNLASDIVTIPNAWSLNIGTSIWDFGSGNTICTGPVTLYSTTQIKNNGPAGTALVLAGPISSAGTFGVNLETFSGGTMTLSGPNTYTGPTAIGDGGISTVSVTSINSVTTPAQQASSSLGKPSSAANGIITIGSAGFPGTLIYTGAGETSDRQINMGGTTGGTTIEMDGAGPLVLTGNIGASANGLKTLTLQGTSTAANTINGTISNSTSVTSLVKAQSGNWNLAGTNRFSGSLTVSAGTLTISGTGNLNGGSYGGAMTNNATLTFASSIGQTWSSAIAGAGNFNLAGTGTLTLSGTASTFTGLFNITSGLLAISSDANLGAVPGTVITNAITLNGGPSSGLRITGNGITINANRGIYLGPNGGEIQMAANDTATYNGIIDGTGVFQMGQNASTGLGTLVLGGSEAYTNATVIAAGTLRLSFPNVIGNSSGIIMSNASVLDVSAIGPFPALSTTNTFTAIGGSITPTTPPTIIGALGGAVDFGTQTVNFSYAPAWTNGDASHVVLNVSQGELALNGNTVNVTNASGTTLDIGNYILVQSANGFGINAQPVLNYIGNLAPNTTASLAIVDSTNLVLQVAPAAGNPDSTVINQNPYPAVSAVYGSTPSINVGATVISGDSSPALGETVSIIIPKVSTNTTTISDSTGDFSLTLPINAVPVGTYPITYSYAGNGTIGPALDTSSSLTITKTNLIITATPQTKVYGQTLPTGAGQTAFTSTGLQNGETIGSVTLGFGGSPAGNTATAGTNTYGITIGLATGGTFNPANYGITYVTNILTVTPLPLGLTGSRLYDGTATAAFNILSITNIVSGDTVSLTSGSATLASSAVGVEPIIDATGLVFSSIRGTNYTKIGATGAVTVTNLVNTASTNIISSFTNGQLTLSWPSDHTGWQLQAQTNDLTVGLTTNWVDVAGTTTTNQIVIPINVTNGNVFYRMVYPPQ